MAVDTITSQDDPLHACPTSIYWEFVDGGAGRIDVVDNTVCWIHIDSPGLTLERSIDLFGTPDRYILILPEGESQLFGAILIENRIGVSQVLHGHPGASDDGDVTLKGAAPVMSVTYFDPATEEVLLEEWLPPSILENRNGPYADILPRWPGLGEKLVGITTAIP